MTSKEIRNQFLDFFKEKGHRIVDSAPVVPFDDPTLLFTNAGMNQFKDVFLGQGSRDYNRATDTQKCIRVSGKHNDLEEVGRDTYHHTFFEMLGNWSLGNPQKPEGGYYKEEAITWAWELLTNVWKLPKERLWATVYRTDHESMDIWKNKTDINPNHVLKFDEKDNFWEMGDTGPCGPCSEIHVNIGDDFENPKWVNAGVEECIEIWNLVFVQYNRDENGKLHDLPAKHVDTGMGFERIVAVLQEKKANYDTDIFIPIIEKISKISGVAYKEKDDVVSMRVIADHIRTLTFAIADGATPGNEGRGYVLRRILRRASRFGRKLNLNEPFLYKLVDVLTETMGDVFPEIITNKKNVIKIIKAEEESFNRTLDRGIELFNSIALQTIFNSLNNPKYNINRVEIILLNKTNNSCGFVNKLEISLEGKGKKIYNINTWTKSTTEEYFELKPIINGETVFKLFDTFGFPIDLTNIMAEEKGLTIDEVSFNRLMDKQKERARNTTKNKTSTLNKLNIMSDNSNIENSEFIGYDRRRLSTKARIVSMAEGYLVLDKTPFYPESGGQVGDTGKIIKKNGEEILIINTVKTNNIIAHEYKGVVNKDFLAEVSIIVDKEKRRNIMSNHSATHLMHAALRKVLGKHVKQSGSLVDEEKLRFDFTHLEKITANEIKEIEKIVNNKIREGLNRQSGLRDIPFEDAKEMGALMFFGDKYGDKVNVVKFDKFSTEFCGGTHVKNTSEIGIFKIVSESSIASGIRRIEAVTGRGVYELISSQENKLSELTQKLSESNDEKRKLEKEISEFELKSKLGGIDEVVKTPIEIGGINLFKGKVEATSMDELKQMGDELRNKIKSGVGVLISAIGEKVGIVCVVSDDLIKEKKIQAGNIVGSVAKIVGGGGGGRPHLATAGGKDVSKIDEALENVDEIIKEL
ncbi:MAG: alanine--tRNA ligase [Melioribacteraceae bacterium]|jgi:alanyl-tRNA synthetase|nr:alanine--tRNA ligase [Melioribacteraceae bacterium]